MQPWINHFKKTKMRNDSSKNKQIAFYGKQNHALDTSKQNQHNIFFSTVFQTENGENKKKKLWYMIIGKCNWFESHKHLKCRSCVNGKYLFYTIQDSHM